MSKKNREKMQQVQEVPAAPQGAGGLEQAGAGEPSKERILLFWGFAALLVLLCWLAEVLLPGVPEYVIEKWLMLAFAAFLGVFLYTFK